MKIEELISRIRNGDRVAFEDTVQAIDAAYRYTTTGFTEMRCKIRPASTKVPARSSASRGYMI